MGLVEGQHFVAEDVYYEDDEGDNFTVVEFPDDRRAESSFWPLAVKAKGPLGTEEPVDEYHAGETRGLIGDLIDDAGEAQRMEKPGKEEEAKEEQEKILMTEKDGVAGRQEKEEKYSRIRREETEEDDDDDVSSEEEDEVVLEEEEVAEGNGESFGVEVAGNDVAFNGSNRSVAVTPMKFATEKKKTKVYQSLMNTYQLSERNRDAYRGLKSDILRYQPGCYITERNGVNWYDYEIPQITTLLLVGPRGSGKSSLVNSLLRVFERENCLTGRAAVSYNSAGNGTLFLQEYDFPLNSPSFCVYDTRSLSEDKNENLENIREWMVAGVRHGAPVFRKSDDADTRKAILCRGRRMDHFLSTAKEVNFVIFVVSGLSVIEAMRNDDKKYFDKLSESFTCPYLSFKDDKPVLVVTHGDLLDISERALVRMQLGEVLGVSPLNIYDIPDKWDTPTRLSIVGMLVDALDHAENNLSFKRRGIIQSFKVPLLNMVMLFLELLLLGLIVLYLWSSSQSDHIPDWHNIRHLWLG
ncbi:unnamed protein product [Victoria cruziana]